MQIADVMSEKVKWVGPTASVQEAAVKMEAFGIGSLPVIDGGKVVGIVTDRDICCRVVAANKDVHQTNVSEIMSTNIVTCFSDEELASAARRMEYEHVRRLAVLFRDRKIAGVLSVEDIARHSQDLAAEVLIATTNTGPKVPSSLGKGIR